MGELPNQLGWLPYALLAAIFAGSIGVLGKFGLTGVDSATATAARAVVMAIVTVSWLAWRGDLGRLTTMPRAAGIAILLTGLAGALSWLFYFKALQLGRVVQVAPIDRLSSVVAVVLAVVILQERVSVKIILGTLLILSGGILIALG